MAGRNSDEVANVEDRDGDEDIAALKEEDKENVDT